MGVIATFYSFKGGVGRTMALANIAVLLSKKGLRVLTVDWDLEAPGLDRYFRQLKVKQPHCDKGIIDLLLDASISATKAEKPNWRDYVSHLEAGGPYPLTFLGSGRSDQEYVRKVLRFNWHAFFEQSGGGKFVELLREQWRKEFDITLIDSRTGITDAGGICTIQLPDVLVLVFTANEQSLKGAKDVALRAQRARQKLAYDRMPLLVFPLPSRFDGRTEFEESQTWLKKFAEEFDFFYHDWLPRPYTPLQILEKTKLPYVAYFSFGEKLPVVSHGTSDPESLGYAYEVAATLLAEEFKGVERLLEKPPGVAVSDKVYNDVTISATPTPELSAGIRDSYLRWFIEQVRAVPLSGVYPNKISEGIRHLDLNKISEGIRHLDLAEIYTPLMTNCYENMDGRLLHSNSNRTQLSALSVLNAHSRLVLLGNPGSGKSFFVNFVALCMAGELLGHSEINLSVLCAPVPALKDEEEGLRNSEEEHQAWDHGPLIPMRVVLREFVARGLAGKTAVTGDTLWQFLCDELPDALRDFARPLRNELLNSGGLLMLDGLDEVPEADEQRTLISAVVGQFAAAFPKVRILVTSRIYAYQKQDWEPNGFAEAVLAPFGLAQILHFVNRWYDFVGQGRNLDKEALRKAINRNSRLHELATHPLLLTFMASFHALHGGSLPDQREDLYEDAMHLLLDQWESRKSKRKSDGSYEVIEPSLAEWLRTDQKTMRRFLNRLAFEAHRDQLNLTGTADIAQDGLAQKLMSLNLNLDARPARLIEYLRDRVGLLERRGVDTYVFPHRTFQEYLAACHLTDHDDFPDNIADLLRAEPNRWREVTLLAGARAVRGAASNAWTLAEALCFSDPPTSKVQDEAGYWGALLAARVLTENNSLMTISERNQSKVARLRGWLTCTLIHGALPPRDRVQAGNDLAVLGDPRFRADTWYLPNEKLLGFVEIPEGSFLMGSDKKSDPEAYADEEPQHELFLPRFYIARYPVTVAQFETFVKDKPYTRWKGGKTPPHKANHPVLYVSWQDALAYCQWLTDKLKNWGDTPPELKTLLEKEGWQVTLPSEAEWEKAARGTRGGIYPWDDKFEEDRTNTKETGINSTSAVGCFPRGATPEGLHDLSGNAWEWTRSLWGEETKWKNPKFKYPYNKDDGREDLAARDNMLRVLRGGSYLLGRNEARCAFRNWLHPYLRVNYGFGFRVAIVGPKEPQL
jgi:formylglycine-generating enzyme required for sulfatase activity